jgi:two-component system, NarL family, response regulator DegU
MNNQLSVRAICGGLMISVVVVDDHPVVRAGLLTVLGSASDIRVVGEAWRGQQALRLVEELKPDVLVLDLNLPDLNGTEVARRICNRHDHTRILILTVHREVLSVFELLECGALGYVLKDEALETLANAVRAVASGENWLSPAIATQVVQRAMSAASPTSQLGMESIASTRLTPRELEVLKLLAAGLDNHSIAMRLFLSTRTVQNHVSHIYDKLGVSSRTEAALYAIRHRLAPAPPGEP